VSPIVIAALPIGNSMKADQLVVLLQQVVDGLIDRGISIVSYACDGTEVERSVQRLFLNLTSKREFKICNPHQGSKLVVIEYGFYRSQAICMVQDSKHALKTMRNNLFSGARFLIFGNFMAMYIHILEMAFEDGSPLYHRDVIKLDRQDDNAATRLFSVQTLEIITLIALGQSSICLFSENWWMPTRIDILHTATE
jgi:hypothetical protein